MSGGGDGVRHAVHILHPLPSELRPAIYSLSRLRKEIVSLDGCKLSSASGGFETTYPFSSTTKSEEGATLVVWSSKWDVEHRPRDGQFVMKEERFLWFAGHETPGDKVN